MRDEQLSMEKQRLLILGNGWAGFQILKKINPMLYNVTFMSPRPYFVFTPLLASSTVGTLAFECVAEPVRNHLKQGMAFHQAHAIDVNWAEKYVVARQALDIDVPDEMSEFRQPFDQLVVAVGCENNTFGIKGVKEHGFFLKDVRDAFNIRGRIIQCFESANYPGQTGKSPEHWLHFCVVGAGPTGVEFAAELADFVRDDLSRAFPDLTPLVKITLFDVAETILGGFDSHLQEYATARFSRTGIDVRTKTQIQEVQDGVLILKSGEKVPFGCLVWNTGLTANAFSRQISQHVSTDKRGRIITNEFFQPFDKDGQPIDFAFSVGDCAISKPATASLTDPGNGLPQTAQVANQEAKFLIQQLHKRASGQPWDKGFVYHHRGSMVYAGGWRALVDFTSAELKGPGRLKGRFAWLLWRTSYWTQQVSLKNKLLIPVFWFTTWLLGRNISRF